jgi:hypothetical protein
MRKQGEDMDDLEKENYKSVTYMIKGEEMARIIFSYMYDVNCLWNNVCIE